MRKELAELLKAPAGNREPVIRRSLAREWLYSTDLPALYGGDIPDILQQELNHAGWETAQEGCWLQMRKPAPEPPSGWFAGPYGPEAACCRSLLERHAAMPAAASDMAERMLIKAGEEGGKAYEEACRALHRMWSEQLRQGGSLPGISLRYFGG